MKYLAICLVKIFLKENQKVWDLLKEMGNPTIEDFAFLNEEEFNREKEKFPIFLQGRLLKCREKYFELKIKNNLHRIF